MNERIYKTMGRTGVISIVVGVLGCTIGLVCGILAIICGGRLLRRKEEVTI